MYASDISSQADQNGQQQLEQIAVHSDVCTHEPDEIPAVFMLPPLGSHASLRRPTSAYTVTVAVRLVLWIDVG